MDIKIGKWSLISDASNYIITQTSLRNYKKDGTLKSTASGSKFFSTIPNAVDYIVHQKINESEVEDLHSLLQEIKEIREWVEDQFKKKEED